MPLHPDAEKFLKVAADIPQPPDITVAEFREQAARLIPKVAPLAIGRVEDRTIPGGSGQDMTVRLYTPEGEGPFPVITWVRGGSFTRTTLDQVDPLRRAFVKLSGCMIAAVDQRLSPEAQYPLPLEDALACARWVGKNAAALGGDPARLGVAGESSGGNIAAALAQLSSRQAAPQFAFQVLLAPLLDASRSTASARELAEGYVLTGRQIDWAFKNYAPGLERTDPRISPLLAKDLRGLPPAVIVTLEYDPVRDEGETYAARLAQAGTIVKRARVAGMMHHFPGPEALPLLARLTRELLDELDR